MTNKQKRAIIYTITGTAVRKSNIKDGCFMENINFEEIIGKVTEFIGGINWEEVINTVKGVIEKIVPVIEGLIGNIGG